MKLFVRMTFYLSLLFFLVVCQLLGASDKEKQNSDDAKMVDAIFDNVLTRGDTYKLLDNLCNQIGTRLSGSAGAAKAVAWSKQVMEGYDFDRVFLQDVMVPHWVRGSEAVAVAKNVPGSENVNLSVIAIGGSVATPANGLTAEVIEVQSLDDVARLGENKVKGRIVFYNRPFEQRNIRTFESYSGAVDQRVRGASQAAKFGAVAIVIRSVTSAFDDVPHTGTLVYADSIARIPAAALGVQSADKLTRILHHQGKVDLFLKMDCKWLPDAPSYNVVGELRGNEFPDEIIVVGGHLDSWDVGQGAHDDGAGSMQSISALRTLQNLGYHPKHTIRAVLFMNEENGLRGGKKYAELAVKNDEKYIAAMESDAGGFTPRGFGVTAPDSIVAKIQSWQPYFDKNIISYIKQGGGGADVGPLHRAFGTPVIGFIPDSQRYFDVHHSENDRFSAVNRRELELGTGAIAALIYFIDKYGL